MSARLPISVITHTRNSSRTLARLLETTAWAAERLVVDMESSDDTRVMAKTAGCRVLESPVAPVIDSVRNSFLEQARHEWILVLDSDEYLADDAPGAVQDLIGAETADVYCIPRYNYIAGHLMRGSGWYPDHQVRLFRQGTVRWSGGHHRPPALTVAEARRRILKPPKCLHIHHLNYVSLSEMIERQLHYALTDEYDARPEAFDFHSYLAESLVALNRRFEPEQDGDLSAALATVMAWDRIMRGLIHWDRLGLTPSLHCSYNLPVMPVQIDDAARAEAAALARELQQLRDELQSLETELGEITSSRSWRVTKPLRSLMRWLRSRQSPPA